MEAVWHQLDALDYDKTITHIIHGGATGADSNAGHWARMMDGVTELRFDADWKRHGKRAGPIRNQKMINHGKPDLVVAFPGGRGTADMVRRAMAAGVTIMEIENRAESLLC